MSDIGEKPTWELKKEIQTLQAQCAAAKREVWNRCADQAAGLADWEANLGETVSASVVLLEFEKWLREQAAREEGARSDAPKEEA